MKLEICCYSIDDAMQAQQNGADRIELCSGRNDGGLTPSFGELLQISKQHFAIPVHPIVRPRGGDFYYSQTEINTMINDIELIRDLKFKGVVFGVLTTTGDINIPVMKRLIHAAQGLSITFHRAFDMSLDPFSAMEKLTDLGVDRILTSGQQKTAQHGIELIKQLNLKSQHTKIMPGCGIRANNIKLFIDACLTEIHSSASKTIPSPMQYQGTNINMSHISGDEFLRYEVDSDEVQKMKRAILNSAQNG